MNGLDVRLRTSLGFNIELNINQCMHNAYEKYSNVVNIVSFAFDNRWKIYSNENEKLCNRFAGWICKMNNEL